MGIMSRRRIKNKKKIAAARMKRIAEEQKEKATQQEIPQKVTPPKKGK